MFFIFKDLIFLMQEMVSCHSGVNGFEQVSVLKLKTSAGQAKANFSVIAK